MRFVLSTLVPSALVAASLGLALASCCVPSALDPQDYLEDLRVKSIDLAALSPGSYDGDYTLALPPGVYVKNRHFKVKVAISEAREVKVSIDEPSSLSSWSAAATAQMNDSFNTMIGRIEASRAIPVDGVSGATYSSKAFQKAVEKAVCP